MSYPTPAPSTSVRPGVVSAASNLLYVAAALIVVNGVLPLPYIGKVTDATRGAYAGQPNVDTVTTAVRASLIVSVIISVIVAAAVVVLGLFDRRGMQPARIITWVLGGIGVLCCGLGVLGNAAGGAFTSLSRNNSNGFDTAAASRRIAKAYPSWHAPVTITVGLLIVVGLITAIILLATPAAHPFFRRGAIDEGAPLAYPAVPYGYPQYPGAPSAPGGQAYPGQWRPPADQGGSGSGAVSGPAGPGSDDQNRPAG